MPNLISNGIKIEYVEYGKKTDPAILLIGGWSVQLTFWPPAFIHNIVAAGYRVIAFDNRDAGLSQKMTRTLPTSPFAPHILWARVLKTRRLVSYTLEDMADDSIGILDALAIDKAHIVGLSMGGMITQILAGKYPGRVLTSTILMSTTNRFGLPLPPLPLSLDVFFSPTPRNDDARRRKSARLWRKIRTREGGYDESQFESGISSTIDRSYSAAGRRRQLEAIIATGDVRRWARKITSPTLVIHGSEDRLARPHGGIDVAATIKDAKFELILGMGHDLPPSKIGEVSQKMLGHFDRRQSLSKGARLTLVG